MPSWLIDTHPRLLFETPEASGGGVDTDAGRAAPADSGDSGTPAAAPEATGDLPGIDLETVPEPVREQVSDYQKQIQADYTRKRQAEAERLRTVESEAAEARALMDRLNDESQALDVINELAERYGLVPNDEIDHEDLTPEQETLREQQEAIAELRKAEEARQSEAQQHQIRDHVFSAIDDYAESLGLSADEDLPEPITRAILAATLAAPQGQDGLPDVAAGIQTWRDAEQAAIERYVASKSAGSPDLSGSSGVEDIDTSTREGRLRAANAVAARHF
jgi:hypothetical protein